MAKAHKPSVQITNFKFTHKANIETQVNERAVVGIDGN